MQLITYGLTILELTKVSSGTVVMNGRFMSHPTIRQMLQEIFSLLLVLAMEQEGLH